METDPLYQIFKNDGIIADSADEWKNMNEVNTESQPTEVVEAPKKEFIREFNGMLMEYEYKFDEDGRIDWQQMIDPRFFFFAGGDKTKEPWVKVDGLRQLAEIRGIKSKETKILFCDGSMVIVSVKIDFISNSENPDGRTWTAIADATVQNIGDKRFAKFLSTIAETRAMGRCIREALGIRLCTVEEMSKEDLAPEDENEKKPVSSEAIAAIERQMQIKKVTTEDLTSLLKAKNIELTSLNQLTVAQGIIVLKLLNDKKQPKE